MNKDYGKEKPMEIFGSLVQGFAQACLNLNIVAGRQASELVTNIDVVGWYPYKRFTELQKIVLSNYNNAGPIMEKVGIEMMLGWYHYGPGKELIKNGLDFLYYQSSSNGFTSVVKGPGELVGSFKLVDVNTKEGTALIHSTTPFDRDMERGVIIGGMSAPGDLIYIDVNNKEDRDYFKVEFH